MAEFEVNFALNWPLFKSSSIRDKNAIFIVFEMITDPFARLVEVGLPGINILFLSQWQLKKNV